MIMSECFHLFVVSNQIPMNVAYYTEILLSLKIVLIIPYAILPACKVQFQYGVQFYLLNRKSDHSGQSLLPSCFPPDLISVVYMFYLPLSHDHDDLHTPCPQKKYTVCI